MDYEVSPAMLMAGVVLTMFDWSVYLLLYLRYARQIGPGL
jgi:hypothetical protein